MNNTNEFFDKGKTAGANNPIAKQMQSDEIKNKYYESLAGNAESFVKNIKTAVTNLPVEAPAMLVARKPEKRVAKGVEKAQEETVSQKPKK